MNEDTLLLEFLEEYLNGLDMVSQYEAVKVGISMLLSEGVFNNTVEISGLLKINYGIIISAERLRQMAGGRVIFMRPAIPA
ncbi:MAG: hypothetical protein MR291_08625 [Oscillospiraceae bacterium]|nr:hypothetical protein [Oscillospiraceae bacterium]